MCAKVAWVLVSSGTQVQPQIIFDPDYLPDYLSGSYDCLFTSLVTIQKCCCHPPGLYLLERLPFRLHQGPDFLVLFVSTNFSIHSYLVQKNKNRKTIILS